TGRPARLDLRMHHRTQLRVEALEIRSLPSFYPPVTYSTSPFSSSIVAGDFNDDGAPDLCVTNSSFANGNSVGVRLNKGDGTFGNVSNYSAGTGVYWVTTGEFNGDGKLDLAVANSYANKMNVLLGNGNGSFKPPVSYATGKNAVHITAGDLN